MLTANAQEKPYEKIIKDYFDGWVRKDLNQVSAQLADGFTFTSATPDDHISTEKFKEKCWVQAQYIQRFDFIRIMGNENEAFAIVHVITTDNHIIRNIEYFNFTNGKIKSIEVFFGGAGQGFPTNTK
ncbi:MAG TPA: nuclear transport factor 2 family protein [Ohtaekwangia sp.]